MCQQQYHQITLAFQHLWNLMMSPVCLCGWGTSSPTLSLKLPDDRLRRYSSLCVSTGSPQDSLLTLSNSSDTRLVCPARPEMRLYTSTRSPTPLQCICQPLSWLPSRLQLLQARLLLIARSSASPSIHIQNRLQEGSEDYKPLCLLLDRQGWSVLTCFDAKH